jgi:hypothetical protein
MSHILAIAGFPVVESRSASRFILCQETWSFCPISCYKAKKESKKDEKNRSGTGK